MSEKKKVISLFAGAGGMDIGFRTAGFDIAVSLEQDSSCCKTLRKNSVNTAVIEGDITTISTDDILGVAKLRPLEAALVIGGPPCQSFSLAGKRMGMDDDRGMLILQFARVVREALPKAFVLENVKGMLNWEKGRAIEAVMNEFREPIDFNGQQYSYEITYKVLNAAHYGAPQFRERLFMVGNRLGKTFDFPSPTHGKRPLNDDLFGDTLLPYVSSWDAIGSLPPATEPSKTALAVSNSIKGRREKHGY